MSETERVALEAGTVWWDRELFSGSPNWKRFIGLKMPTLTSKEKAFLSGPVTELCKMLDEWENAKQRDLPPHVWEFIKRNRFFGMIIPEEYGGLGFSALAHSAVITKIASRSVTAAVTVMVPNSLGPAELVLHYGTPEQKRQYLPDLASGKKIPCFALTGPEAGSDAAATASEGIVCMGTYNGSTVLGMLLNWEKRYITLAPICDVIGLAFRLKDPQHILGAREDRGITCALIPSDLPGIDISKRHDPMNVPFMNGPCVGRNVFVPLDFIIGGVSRAGQGWEMLMQSLAAGRAISLPSLATGSAQLATRLVTAYSTIREQFGVPIGEFEGVQEAIARVAGLTYLMNSSRVLTVGAISAGHRPSVISAIMKAYSTEQMRKVINDAMDIRAGSEIVRGPRNVLAMPYLALPIGITVEGANILTRSLIVYGQGMIRCHPYLYEELRAIKERDVALLDGVFYKHLWSSLMKGLRAPFFAMGGGVFVKRPSGSELSAYFQRFTRISCAFSLLTEAALVLYGGKIKRKEMIAGRFSDALAWMYLGTASLKRFHDEGQREQDLPFAKWSCEYSLFQAQKAIVGILQNMRPRFIGVLLKGLIFPLGPRYRLPNDVLSERMVKMLFESQRARNHLTADVFIPDSKEPGLGMMEAALDTIQNAQNVKRRIQTAIRVKKLPKLPEITVKERARMMGIISQSEFELLKRADRLRDEIIAVDSFTEDSANMLRQA